MYPYRFKITLIIFIVFLFGIVVRLFQLQIVESNKYKGISKIAVLLRIHLRPHEGLSSTETERSWQWINTPLTLLSNTKISCIVTFVITMRCHALMG